MYYLYLDGINHKPYLYLLQDRYIIVILCHTTTVHIQTLGYVLLTRLSLLENFLHVRYLYRQTYVFNLISRPIIYINVIDIIGSF